MTAGAVGIEPRAVVGEFTPDAGGDFDLETFELNPDFVRAFAEYMNEEGVKAPELLAQAAAEPEGFLYLVDPRHPFDPDSPSEPPGTDIVGRFLVDAQGGIVADSFEYNADHVLFDPETGVSGILHDRKFYDWLHPDGPKPA